MRNSLFELRTAANEYQSFVSWEGDSAEITRYQKVEL